MVALVRAKASRNGMRRRNRCAIPRWILGLIGETAVVSRPAVGRPLQKEGEPCSV